MDDLGIIGRSKDREPNLTGQEGVVLRGYVANIERVNGTQADSATSPNDRIEVRIPSYDMSRTFGPLRFAPQAAADGSVLLPERGDDCVVSFDEDGEPQLVSWWQDDVTSSNNRVTSSGGVVEVTTAIHFTAIVASAAPNNSLFRDTADGKLKYKDNGGSVNALY